MDRWIVIVGSIRKHSETIASEFGGGGRTVSTGIKFRKNRSTGNKQQNRNDLNEIGLESD